MRWDGERMAPCKGMGVGWDGERKRDVRGWERDQTARQGRDM